MADSDCDETVLSPIDWHPMCGSDRTSCWCMEPNISGPCEEFKACGSPRCGECGWPPYRHTEPSGGAT